MTTLTETPHAGGFIASEANGMRSRETITVLSGQNLKAGAVLGKVTTGTPTGAAVGSPTGGGTITGVSIGAEAKPGVYRITCIATGANAGKFQVEDPDGINLGVAVVGVAFTGPINFTLNDVGTDFAPGDEFTVTVAAGSSKYVEYDNAATNGAQNAAAVLFDATDASGGDKKAVAIVRDAEITNESLIWKIGQDTTAKNAALADLKSLGVVAR